MVDPITDAAAAIAWREALKHLKKVLHKQGDSESVKAGINSLLELSQWLQETKKYHQELHNAVEQAQSVREDLDTFSDDLDNNSLSRRDLNRISSNWRKVDTKMHALENLIASNKFYAPTPVTFPSNRKIAILNDAKADETSLDSAQGQFKVIRNAVGNNMDAIHDKTVNAQTNFGFRLVDALSLLNYQLECANQDLIAVADRVSNEIDQLK